MKTRIIEVGVILSALDECGAALQCFNPPGVYKLGGIA